MLQLRTEATSTTTSVKRKLHRMKEAGAAYNHTCHTGLRAPPIRLGYVVIQMPVDQSLWDNSSRLMNSRDLSSSTVTKLCRHATFRRVGPDKWSGRVLTEGLELSNCDLNLQYRNLPVFKSASLRFMLAKVPVQVWILKLNETFARWPATQHCKKHSWHTSICILTGSR